MFSFLFKGATYYILWKKFQTQILLVVLSFLLIVLILSIYSDLFSILKVSHKENLIWLLISKWILITLIIGFNIYKLKQVKLNDDEKQEIFDEIKNVKKYPKKSEEVINKKEKLMTTTDVILKKYSNE